MATRIILEDEIIKRRTYPEIVTALLAVMNTRVFNQSGVDLNMLTSETIRQRKLILPQRRQLK